MAGPQKPNRVKQADKPIYRNTAVVIGLALAGLILIYFVARPARVDACASEVLTNSRGVKVNLGTKTLTLSAESEEVSIERIAGNNAVLIDGLSRLCRERQSGLINAQEYESRFNRIVAPMIHIAKPEAPQVHLFKDDIDVVGWSGNRNFIKFLDENDGEVVKINSMIDVSGMMPESKYNENCYFEKDYSLRIYSDEKLKESQELFNRTLPLPLLPADQPWWNSEEGGGHSCEEYMIFIKTQQEENYIAAGNARVLRLNGLFRVAKTAIGDSITYKLFDIPIVNSQN